MIWLVSFCWLLHLLLSLRSEAAAPVAVPGRKTASLLAGSARGASSVIKAGRESGKRLAYYSVFCGTDSNDAAVVFDAPSKAFDCYFITDNDKAFVGSKAKGWVSMRMPGEASDDDIGANMKCKDLRTRPHRYRFLSSYDFLVFIDSKIAKDVHDFRTLSVIEGMPATAALVHRRHNLLTEPPFSVWQEFELAMNQHRYKLQEAQMAHYVNKKLQSGFSEHKATHLLGGYIVRSMRHPRVREIGEYWYQNILECGIEDQISLFFVHQRFHDLYHVIDSFPI
jgi:hypothetical protein